MTMTIHWNGPEETTPAWVRVFNTSCQGLDDKTAGLVAAIGAKLALAAQIHETGQLIAQKLDNIEAAIRDGKQ